MAKKTLSDVWPFLVGVAVCLGNVLYGMRTGRVIFLTRLVKRHDETLLFWFAVLFSGLVGAFGIFLFIVPLL